MSASMASASARMRAASSRLTWIAAPLASSIPAIIAVGILIAPLPGPGGLPVIVVGLMVTLRNSFWAKRQFIRFQRAHPRMIFPIRRLLRREPEVMPVFWQSVLRMERVVLPRKRRFVKKVRKHFRRR